MRRLLLAFAVVASGVVPVAGWWLGGQWVEGFEADLVEDAEQTP